MAAETVELATAYLSLVPTLKGSQGKIAEELGVEGKPAGEKLGGGLVTGLRGALGPVAGIMAGVFGAKAVVDWGRAQIDSLARIETINAQTATAIKSTGGAAGVTAEHVEQLAGKLENLTATEAESIQQGANMLLTFKNIQNGVGEGNDIFDQATTSLVDMSRAMGSDPQTAAIQLGKALNDPVAGISALSRVGIQFTDDQKAVIQSLVETGQTAEAQKIILAELNSQFGGSGQAYAETYAGKVELLGHAWGTFGETLFSTAMPALTASVGWLTDVVNAATGVISILFLGDYDGGLFKALGVAEDSPLVDFLFRVREGFGAVGPLVSAFGEAVGPLIGQIAELWMAFSPLSLLFQVLQPILPQLAAVFGQLASTVGGALTTALQAILSALAPVVEILVGQFSSVLQVLIPVIAQIASTIGGALGATLTALAPVVAQIATALGGVLATVLTALSPLISMVATLLGQVLAAVLPLIDPILGLVGALLPLLAPIIELVGALLEPLIGLLTALLTPILALITPLVDLLAGALGVVINVLATVIEWVVQGITWFLKLVTGSEEAGAQLNAVWSGVGRFFADVWNGIVTGLSDAIAWIGSVVGGIWNTVMGALGGIGAWLVNAGRDLIQGFIDGIMGMVGAVGDAIGGVMDFIGGFFPHSPAERGPFSGAGWTAVKTAGLAVGEQFGAGLDGSADFIGSVMSDILALPSTDDLAPRVGMNAYTGTSAGDELYPANDGDGYDGPPIEIHSNDPDLVGTVVADKLRRR